MPYNVPARYAPYLAHVLQRALDEVRLDETFRSDSDPRIQRFASVPDSLIDPNASGDALVAITNTTGVHP